MRIIDYQPVMIFGFQPCIIVSDEEYIYKCWCGEPAKVYTRNTAYHEECYNVGVACDECLMDEFYYYEERWAEYYGSKL